MTNDEDERCLKCYFPYASSVSRRCATGSGLTRTLGRIQRERSENLKDWDAGGKVVIRTCGVGSPKWLRNREQESFRWVTTGLVV